MACYGCPYLQNYDLIWRSPEDPSLVCLMLWCCAGPELQVRRGDDVLLDEFYPTRLQVYDRAEQLRDVVWGEPIGTVSTADPAYSPSPRSPSAEAAR